MTAFACTLAMILLLSLSGTATLWAQEREARRAVLQTLAKVDASAVGSTHVRTWTHENGWTNLARQLDAGKLADPKRVRDTIEKLAALDASTFAALKATTNEWLQQLDVPPEVSIDELNAVSVVEIKAATAQRREIDNNLAAQLNKLDHILQNSVQTGAQWRKYLGWEQTKKLVAGTELTDAELDGLETRWTLAQTHWNTISFRLIAQTVIRSIILRRRESYPELVEKLPGMLRSIVLENITSKTSPLPISLKALDGMDLGAALSIPLQRSLAAPHCQLRIDASALVPKTESPVDETYDINDVFAGTRVQGDGRMRGTLTINPAEGELPAWRMAFKGNSTSSTSGNNSGVAVSSTATATVEGSKRIEWRERGFIALPADANARATVSFNGISTGGRRSRQSAARSEVYASRAIAERDTERAIQQACVQRLDRQCDKLLAPLNQRYEEYFTRPINSQQAFAPRVATTSAKGEILWSCWYTPVEGVGLASLPEPLPEKSDWSLTIHEEFLARHIATFFEKRDLSLQEIEAALALRTGRTAATETSANETERANEASSGHLPRLLLRAIRPVEVQLAEQSMVLRLHLDEFTATQGKVSTPATIECNYQIKLDHGVISLTRLSSPEVHLQESAEGTTGRLQTLKTILRRQISRAIPEQFEFPPDTWLVSQGTYLNTKGSIESLHITNGWLLASGRIIAR